MTKLIERWLWKPMKEKLLRIEEIAEITGFATKTLYNKISSGTMFIPYCKIGRSIRFKQSVVDNYLKKIEITE